LTVPTPATTGDPRTAQIAANAAALRDRIAMACVAADRDPAEVTLVAVTKTFPVDDVRRLLALGIADVGENRDQEARSKVSAVPAARWHFVGRLQRNKCRSVASYAVLVHSVDRVELVAALDAGARRAGRAPLDVLVQVSLDQDAARGGALPADVPGLAAAAAAAGGLRFAGLMAVAPLGADPLPSFRRLADLAAEVRRDHPSARILSAGMSGDLEAALRCGATHVRIGTALLGGRTPPVG
jgi:pyridoxal phosphate enzyme (YggS family)